MEKNGKALFYSALSLILLPVLSFAAPSLPATTSSSPTSGGGSESKPVVDYSAFTIARTSCFPLPAQHGKMEAGTHFHHCQADEDRIRGSTELQVTYSEVDEKEQRTGMRYETSTQSFRSESGDLHAYGDTLVFKYSGKTAATMEIDLEVPFAQASASDGGGMKTAFDGKDTLYVRGSLSPIAMHGRSGATVSWSLEAVNMKEKSTIIDAGVFVVTSDAKRHIPVVVDGKNEVEGYIMPPSSPSSTSSPSHLFGQGTRLVLNIAVSVPDDAELHAAERAALERSRASTSTSATDGGVDAPAAALLPDGELGGGVQAEDGEKKGEKKGKGGWMKAGKGGEGAPNAEAKGTLSIADMLFFTFTSANTGVASHIRANKPLLSCDECTSPQLPSQVAKTASSVANSLRQAGTDVTVVNTAIAKQSKVLPDYTSPSSKGGKDLSARSPSSPADTSTCIVYAMIIRPSELSAVAAVMEVWKGPIVALVYADDLTLTFTAVTDFAHMYEEVRDRVIFRFVRVGRGLPPLSSLRNSVIEVASSVCVNVVVVDGGGVPSSNAEEKLKKMVVAGRDKSAKTILLLPSFDIVGVTSSKDLPATKKELKKLVVEERVVEIGNREGSEGRGGGGGGGKGGEGRFSSYVQQWMEAEASVNVYHPHTWVGEEEGKRGGGEGFYLLPISAPPYPVDALSAGMSIGSSTGEEEGKGKKGGSENGILTSSGGIVGGLVGGGIPVECQRKHHLLELYYAGYSFVMPSDVFITRVPPFGGHFLAPVRSPSLTSSSSSSSSSAVKEGGRGGQSALNTGGHIISTAYPTPMWPWSLPDRVCSTTLRLHTQKLDRVHASVWAGSGGAMRTLMKIGLVFVAFSIVAAFFSMGGSGGGRHGGGGATAKWQRFLGRRIRRICSGSFWRARLHLLLLRVGVKAAKKVKAGSAEEVSRPPLLDV